MSLVALMFVIPANPISRQQDGSWLSNSRQNVPLVTNPWLAYRSHPPEVTLLRRRFENESHDKDCNRDGATEVSNVRVESFHAASASGMSLLFFLWPMAKA